MTHPYSLTPLPAPSTLSHSDAVTPLQTLLAIFPTLHMQNVLPVLSLRGFSITDDVLFRLVHILVIIVCVIVIMQIIFIVLERWRHISTSIALAHEKVGAAKRVDTLHAIIRNTCLAIIWSLAGFMILSEVGINIAPLIAGAGVAGVAVGFGLQTFIKDIFYGFFILFENQFGLGDVLQVGNSVGTVERLSLRTVTLRDDEGRLHVIPNNEAARFILIGEGWGAFNIPVEVSMKSAPDDAARVINEVTETFGKTHADDFTEPPKCLGLDSFTPRGMLFRVIGKNKPNKQWDLMREYRVAVKNALDAAGIEIPMSP